jgi:hypothetical protein
MVILEFLAGSAFTIILIILIRSRLLRSNFDKKYLVSKLVYRQSYIHDLVGSEINRLMAFPKAKSTQSRDLASKDELRVVFVDGLAYWVKDNCFYQANVVEGKIDDFSKKIVDTMGMNKVELDKMFFIVQKLTEGKKNDGRGPGLKGL